MPPAHARLDFGIPMLTKPSEGAQLTTDSARSLPFRPAEGVLAGATTGNPRSATQLQQTGSGSSPALALGSSELVIIGWLPRRSGARPIPMPTWCASPPTFLLRAGALASTTLGDGWRHDVGLCQTLELGESFERRSAKRVA